MIKYISGDILQSKDEYIAQGVAVGSQEGLGTGLAFKLSSQFPEIQKLFKKYTRNTKFQAGDVFIGEIKGFSPGIIYIATQPDMYHAELTYLNKGLKRLKKVCESRGIKTVSLPKIGAGLGKLDWNRRSNLCLKVFYQIVKRYSMYMKITRLNTKFSLQHTPVLPNGGKLQTIISIKH